MAKRKASKSPEQSELPLDDTPPAPSQGKGVKPGRGKKSVVKAEKTGTTEKRTAGKAPPVAGRSQKPDVAEPKRPPEIASQASGAGGDAPASQPKGTDIVT